MGRTLRQKADIRESALSGPARRGDAATNFHTRRFALSTVLEDGVYVAAGTSQRFACDACRVLMRHDADGRVTEVGARTRTISPALRRAPAGRPAAARHPPPAPLPADAVDAL